MRRAAKRKVDPVAAEVGQMRAELVALGLHVIALRRELSEALMWRPVEDGDPGDLIGVNEAALAAGRSAQTLRRWADAGLPVGGFNARLGRYVYSRKALGAYLREKKKTG